MLLNYFIYLLFYKCNRHGLQLGSESLKSPTFKKIFLKPKIKIQLENVEISTLSNRYSRLYPFLCAAKGPKGTDNVENISADRKSLLPAAACL